jgi:hypothetical protein
MGVADINELIRKEEGGNLKNGEQNQRLTQKNSLANPAYK